ncbi:MAG: DUF1353 domain-containing protein [Oceanobacter sp.]
MKINGLNGSSYVVDEYPDLSGVQDSILRNGSTLSYVGSTESWFFVVSGRTVSIRVPFGFEWDGASIPGFGRWLVGHPLDNAFRVPSLVHDAGYAGRTTRVLHDVIFFHLLRQFGVPLWKASIMYTAVRIGGHVYYASETSRLWRGVKRVLDRS